MLQKATSKRGGEEKDRRGTTKTVSGGRRNTNIRIRTIDSREQSKRVGGRRYY